ncbi:hypothetical protein, partial [Pseudoalteromonas sp. D48-MNA-CIBAN-0056]|uniref:hypothetical protein n=1 Tax=Pseudoalteromonas sp. D48-MNA-CIBAN-0056 TaxID=3140417 RepID=UPI0033349750
YIKQNSAKASLTQGRPDTKIVSHLLYGSLPLWALRHYQAPNKRNPLQQCDGFFVVCRKVKILAISRQLSVAQR